MNRNNSGGVSKILIIVIVVLIIIAAFGAVAYVFFKNNNAEIDYTVTGVVVNDSDVFVYLNDEEIYKYEVSAQNEFTITGKTFYAVSKNETKNVTLSSKVVEKDGEVIQMTSEIVTVTGNGKYNVDLVFPFTTIESELDIELNSDATVKVSTQGILFGTHKVEADSKEEFKDTLVLVISGDIVTVTVKVAIEYSDGSTKDIEETVDVVLNGTTKASFVIDNDSLTA
jgi:hypothetical protein